MSPRVVVVIPCYRQAHLLPEAVASVAAQTFDDLACVVAGIPAADFARLVRSHVPSFVLRTADRFGFSFDGIEKLLRVVSPFALAPGLRTPLPP